ncbi:MAG: hypothetical protein L0226_15050 [Acidobacteria bacterium]|nr:hypothetical protein [Acidobacteriota bacterium]
MPIPFLTWIKQVPNQISNNAKRIPRALNTDFEEEQGTFRTPPFNPNVGQPNVRTADFQYGRDDTPDTAPRTGDYRYGRDDVGDDRMVPLNNPPVVLPSRPFEAEPPQKIAPELPDRRDVPIPPLPGRSGQPTPYSPTNAARYDYVMKGAQRDAEGNLVDGGKIKRSFGDVLKGAGLGFLRGAAANPNNPLAGGLGGAVGGGIIPAINPTMGREALFNQIYLPQMQQQQAEQQAIAAQQQQAVETDQQRRLREAQIGKTEAETKAIGMPKVPAPPAPPRPVSVAPGSTLVNPVTGQAIYTSKGRPEKPLSTTDLQREARLEEEEEGSTEAIAMSSYEARGGDEYVKTKLPKKTQEILDTGKVNGEPASPQEIAQANARWQTAIKDQKNRDKAETDSVRLRNIAKKVGERRRSGSQPSSRSPKATVSSDFINFTAKRLNISPEEARRKIEAAGYRTR